MTTFCLTNAAIVTMNDAYDIVYGDVRVVDGRITGIGPDLALPGTPSIDCAGDWIVPGFVQAHLHLTQTLFRHQAEGRPLLKWLRERIWPLEGAHDAESNAVSARLGIAELLRGGTTTVLDMGTVHHEDAIAEELDRSGIRAAFGKAMMDTGDGVPASLIESTQASLDASIALGRRWHGADDDRLRYAFAPRFILSCTADLQREVGRLSRERGWLIHTHSSEQTDEIEAVEAAWGQRNIHALHTLGLTGKRTVFAHGVHLDASERAVLKHTCTSVCHCPSSNLKLGSGVADVVGLLGDGVNVAIGADGAPCNNGLDAMVEMRLAHLLQCAKRAPGALPARDVLAMATRRGAQALDWADRIGSIEVGKDADLVRVRADDFASGHDGDPYAAIVCAGARDMIRDVWVRGRQLVRAGELLTVDVGPLQRDARAALRRVVERAQLAG